MAKPELGTKRTDPETGRKFFDLNKDPVVSPYTGKSYPMSFFEGGVSRASAKREVEEEEVEVVEIEAAPNTVSLSDVEDDEEAGAKEGVPDVDDDSDDEDDAPDDTFLADEEEDDEDVTDIIGGGHEDDDDT